MKIAHILTSLALLTASCDIVLAVNVGGTVRFCQIMLLGVCLCALAQMLQTGRILWPRGGTALALWCIVQGLLISQSPAFQASVALYAVLFFSIIGIAAVVQLYGQSPRIAPLMKVYLYSFVVTAAFGAMQFVLPTLHLGSPLVVQWIVPGLIPRINGFSYEPSYFATYLIMGWIMLVDLRISRARITQQRRWFWFLLLVSAVLFLSTSKTAWLLIALEGLSRFLPSLLRVVRRQARRLNQGSWVVTLPRARVLMALAVFVVVLAEGIAAVSRVVNLNIFLSGSGLNGTAAHSLNDRVAGFAATLAVTQQHFWIGRSLGGVPATIALHYGFHLTNIAQLRTFWGFPVPLEVFAASGFWGFLPFLWFFLVITGGERKLIRVNWEDDRAKWLRALIRALIFEWLALCADQNLLRSYLWFHVTMVVVVGYNLRYFRDRPQPVPVLAIA